MLAPMSEPSAVHNHPPVMSREAAAAALSCHPRTVDRYIARGHLRAHRDPASQRVGVEVAGVRALAARRVLVPR